MEKFYEKYGIALPEGESRRLPASGFRSAVIGWAGVIGGEAAGKDLMEWREDVAKLWSNLKVGGLGFLSLSDAASINQHPQKWRSFKTAVQIIEREFSALKFVAGELVKYGEYKSPKRRGNMPVYLTATQETMADQGGRLTMLSPNEPAEAPFDLRLAQSMPTKSPAVREKIYHAFLVSEIRACRAKMGKTCNTEFAERVALENEEVNKRDGLAASVFVGFPSWHKSYIAAESASKERELKRRTT